MRIETLMVVLLVAATGCATRPALAPAAPAEAEWEEVNARFEDSRRRLLAGPHDLSCSEVCGLTDLLCAASERICAIAARRPEPEYGLRCQAVADQCRAARPDCEGCR